MEGSKRIRIKITLRKPCERCGKVFQPFTRHSKLCDKCFFEARSRVNYLKQMEVKQNAL